MKEKNKSGKCQTIATWIGEKVTTMDTAAGADKGAAVEQVRRRLGFGKEQVLAMGDAWTDICIKEYTDGKTGFIRLIWTSKVHLQADKAGFIVRYIPHGIAGDTGIAIWDNPI